MTKIGQMIFDEGVEQGLSQGLSQGLEQGIEQVEKKFGQLIQKLIHDSRTEDLLRATHDKVFRECLYQEYGINK